MDGTPRQHARFGLWLAGSLLLHGVAVTLLESGIPAGAAGGGNLQVRLVGAPPAAAAANAAAPAREETRRRDAERRRIARPSHTAAVSEEAAAAPITPAREDTPPATRVTPPTTVMATRVPRPSHTDAIAPPGTPERKDTPPATRVTPPPTVAASRVARASPVVSTPDQSRLEPETVDAPPAPRHAHAEPAPRRIDKPVTAPKPDLRAATETRLDTPAPARADAKPATTAATPSSAGAVTAPAANAAVTTTASGAPVSLAGANGATSARLDADGEKTLLALLHTAIDGRKRYPTLARRQRREGIATVLFRLHPDGAVDRLTLAASSGFALLDKAALRAVAEVAPFAPARRYLDREKEYAVEVEFRLF